MWGEKWGEMIWGGGSAAAVQIPLGPWTLLFLGFILGACAVLARNNRMARILPIFVLLIVPFLSIAVVPNIFQNGSIADAGEVNENFADIESRVGDGKFTIELTSDPNDDVSIALPQRQFEASCLDADGCSFRLCSQQFQELVCHRSTSFLFLENTNQFNISGYTQSGIFFAANGTDFNGSAETLVETGLCSFRDAPAGEDDLELGFYLVVDNAPATSCFLTIDD